MKPYIFTGLAPNVQRDDVVRALWLFFTLQIMCKKEALAQLADCIRGFFGTKHVFLFESGRSALASLLMAFQMRAGDEVLLQAYTCVAVPNAVLWAGATPVYVDCSQESLTMSPQDLEKKITSRSRVLIIQHTFGIPAALDELLQIATQHNLIVIEDCAHTIGGEYHGKKLGTFGDASIISFGRDKPLSSVFGGAAIINDTECAVHMRSFFASLTPPSWFWSYRQLLQPCITACAKATYFFGFGKILLYFSLLLRFIYPAVTRKERQGKKPSFVFHSMPCSLASLALHQWKKLERFNAHRMRLSALYRDALGGMQGVQLVDTGKEHTVLLRVPLCVDNAARALSFARARGIYLGDWYMSPIAPSGVAFSAVGYTQGSCPIAEKYSTMTVNLPTSIGISEEDARRIIVCIKSYLDSLRVSV